MPGVKDMESLVEWYAGDMECHGCGKALTTEFTLERHHCLDCMPIEEKPVRSKRAATPMIQVPAGR